MFTTENILSLIVGGALHFVYDRYHGWQEERRSKRSIWDHFTSLGNEVSVAVSTPLTPQNTLTERISDTYICDAIRIRSGSSQYYRLPQNPAVTSLENLNSHLLIIGSPKYNKYATLIQKQFDTCVQFVWDQYAGEPVSSLQKLVTRHGEEYVATEDLKCDADDKQVDYGLLFHAVLENGKHLLWLAGIHGPATVGVWSQIQSKPQQFAAIRNAAPGSATTWLFRVTYERGVEWGQKGCERHIDNVEPLGHHHATQRHQPEHQVKSIIFDLGNVLMNFDRTSAYRALGHWLHRDWNAVQKSIDKTGLRAQYELGNLNTDQFRRQIYSVLGVTDTVITPPVFYEFWADIFFPNIKMIHALQTLDQQNQHTLVLLSNTNELHFNHVKATFPEVLAPFSTRCVLSFREHCDKSSAKIYLKAVKASGSTIESASCLFIDDNPEFVSKAKAVGMMGIVYFKYPQFVVRLREHGVYLD